MTDDFYADPEVCQAILMDYYKNPRCSGVCDSPTHAAEATNPACGDIVKLSFQIENDYIIQARTTGAGCAVSQASASLLAEQLQGKTLTEASVLLSEFNNLLAGRESNPDILDLLFALQVIRANPARVCCAKVAAKAAIAALK